MYRTLGQISDQDYVAADELDRFGERADHHSDLRAILGLVRRHKWTIILTFVLIVTTALLITLQIERRYTATALVVVDNRDSQLLGFQAATDGVGDALVDTEVEIARSSAVLRRAADALDLASSGEYDTKPPLLDMLRTMIGLGMPAQAAPDSDVLFAELPDKEQARIVEQLSRSLDIDRRGITSVISVSATATSAEGAAETANTVANAYLEEQIDAKLMSNDRATAILGDRVKNLGLRVAEAERGIDKFVSSKLEQLGSPESKALLVRLSEEASKRVAIGATLADLQQALGNEDYVRLAEVAETQRAGLAQQRLQLVTTLAESGNQKRLANAQQKLQALDEEIKAAAQRRASDLQDEILLSNGLSASLRNQIDVALNDVRLPADVSTELFRLERDVETNRTLYDSAITKLRQVEQQGDFKIPDSRVIASATPPSSPSYPPRRLIMAAAAMFALGFGVSLAFLREHLIGGITSIEQFENLTSTPVAAVVPRYSPPGGALVETAVINQPLSAFSEAIRRIQLNLFLLAPKDKRCILVTSPVPGDGKTTMAIALARQMAMSGSSVILIDADLRRPTVYKHLNVQVEQSLIDILSQPHVVAPYELAITKEENTGVSYVLSSKASVVATDTLLLSKAFDQLMKFARENYDVVIIDSPPAGLVVDAAIVARHCDAAVFVVRYASTSQQQVKHGIRELMRTSLPTCGVLNQLTEADSKQFGYGNMYRAYYGSNG
jgi:succinoglycan biosynthesis transport protein ExoP